MSDPFRCFVGRRVEVEDWMHVVEGYEVHGRNLLFRLRRIGSGEERRVTVLELLELLERAEPGERERPRR
ncbi:MAG TPA: hypothetical protein VF210_20485 [Pseudomonadales bacterium]